MDTIHVSQILFLFWQLQCDFPWDFTILAALALYRQGERGEKRPSQEVRLSKCQQKCQHVTPRYFGQQVQYKSIRQIQRPAKSLATTSLFSISPIQWPARVGWVVFFKTKCSLFNEIFQHLEWVYFKCDSEQIHCRKRCSNALWKMH